MRRIASSFGNYARVSRGSFKLKNVRRLARALRLRFTARAIVRLRRSLYAARPLPQPIAVDTISRQELQRIPRRQFSSRRDHVGVDVG
jgi:hypothetical protein